MYRYFKLPVRYRYHINRTEIWLKIVKQIILSVCTGVCANIVERQCLDRIHNDFFIPISLFLLKRIRARNEGRIIDRLQMDHQQIDHQQIDHLQIDHQQIDHLVQYTIGKHIFSTFLGHLELG